MKGSDQIQQAVENLYPDYNIVCSRKQNVFELHTSKGHRTSHQITVGCFSRSKAYMYLLTRPFISLIRVFKMTVNFKFALKYQTTNVQLSGSNPWLDKTRASPWLGSVISCRLSVFLSDGGKIE